MQIRKEQFVLLNTLDVIGLLAWRSLGPQPSRSVRATGEPPAFVEHSAPDPARVAPAVRGTTPELARELFAAPRDTRPLPPLEFQPPPSVALPGLRPPTLPGPAPARYGKLLRAALPALDAPDLFATEAVGEALGGAAADAPANLPLAQRIASFKRVYDWVRTNDFKFGQIVNKDRFNLQRRPNEPILFVEYVPERGAPLIAGAAPVPYEQKTVNEFGFADTVPNQIEIRRAAFGDTLAAAEYDSALAFADWCVEKRHEAPRALGVAEEVYRRAAAVITTDPMPRLGLARCYEAGFEFEKAFQEYRALLGATNNNQRVLARLAELEARFRLFDAARAHLEEAARGGRTDWQVQFAYGHFLATRGEYTAAIEHLRLANQFEPSAAEGKRDRARLRVELASALLADGNTTEALEWVDKALQADPADARAQAAQLALVALGALPAPSTTTPPDDPGTFELLLARGSTSCARATRRARPRPRTCSSRLHRSIRCAPRSRCARSRGWPRRPTTPSRRCTTSSRRWRTTRSIPGRCTRRAASPPRATTSTARRTHSRARSSSNWTSATRWWRWASCSTAAASTWRLNATSSARCCSNPSAPTCSHYAA
ncbi:MAG: hypothetical protein IPJ19_01690 [Planctomycetes bacterium]|nr:hypothetical protein [Planctomycetota bacterium]